MRALSLSMCLINLWLLATVVFVIVLRCSGVDRYPEFLALRGEAVTMRRGYGGGGYWNRGWSESFPVESLTSPLIRCYDNHYAGMWIQNAKVSKCLTYFPADGGYDAAFQMVTCSKPIKGREQKVWYFQENGQIKDKNGQCISYYLAGLGIELTDCNISDKETFFERVGDTLKTKKSSFPCLYRNGAIIELGACDGPGAKWQWVIPPKRV